MTDREATRVQPLQASPRSGDAPVPLYAAVLGEGWDSLHPNLKRAHHGPGVRGVGHFRVTLAQWPGARWLLRLGGLPPPAEDALVQLTVSGAPQCERWLRTFDTHRLETVQRSRGSRLVERFGPVELVFHISVEQGAIVFQQKSAAVSLGAWRLPLPRILAPTVTAREWAGEGRRIHVEVRIRLPFVGEITSYSGWIEIEEPGS